tara:strand:- start:249 stop:428 length:180 start_codon:yes stop_codon:yes gene_type:complete
MVGVMMVVKVHQVEQTVAEAAAVAVPVALVLMVVANLTLAVKVVKVCNFQVLSEIPHQQ